MKNRARYLSLVVLLTAVALSVTACPPSFFSGSNVTDPVHFQNTAFMPNGDGLLQMVIAPGTLAVGAANASKDVKIYCDLGSDSSRRLQIWDFDNNTYLTLDGTTALASAATLIKKYVVFRPNINAANVTMAWSYMMDGSTELRHRLVLTIDSSDVISRTDIGTVIEFKIKHDYNDADYGWVHAFKAGTYEMVQDRVGYVRAGANSSTRPQILDTSVDDNETGVNSGHEFHLFVGERLGNLQAILVNQGAYASDTSDNIYHSMPVIDEIIDGDTYDYKFGLPKGMLAGTDYYWVILLRADGDNGWPTSGGDMPLTQDLDGNSIQDSDTLFHTTGSGPESFDFASVIGGSTTNTRVYYLKFTTAP